MKLWIISWRLALLLSLVLGAGSLAVSAETPDLAIKFAQRAITFSGRVDSEETGQELARTVRKIRPDLPIQNAGLRIESDTKLPPLADLKSLLAEIGLSSHEGGVAFYPDRVVLTGMTDSVVTVTAIQLRLNPILGERTLVNRICIVSSADLPDLDVRLSSGESSESLLDFDFYPTAEAAFVTPGLPLEKLYSTLVLMSSFERFVDPAKLRESANVRATPLVMEEPGTSSPNEEVDGPPQLRAVPSGPITTYIELEPLLFSRDSFLPRSQSRSVMTRNQELLESPPYAGKKVIVRSFKWQGTSPAYIEYLAEKRSAEARKQLNGIGIPDSQIEIDLVSSPNPVDRGEVKIIVEIPPPADPVENGDEPGSTAVTPTDNESESPAEGAPE